MMDVKKAGRLIKYYRNQQKKTRRNIAEECLVSIALIEKFEQGRGGVSLDVFFQILSALHLKLLLVDDVTYVIQNNED